MIEPRNSCALVLCAIGLVALTGCTPGDETAADESEVEGMAEPREVVFGPVDGHELPPADLERISAGDIAPDFTAMSSGGEPITLSSFRGEKNVVLFFYRGHW